MSNESPKPTYEPITEFVKNDQSTRKVIAQAKAADAYKKIGDEYYIDREKLLNSQNTKCRRLTDSEKIEFHYQKYRNVNTGAKISQIITKIETGLENRYVKIDSFADQINSEKDEEKKKGLHRERVAIYGIANNSELKLEAALKRREEIEAEQKAVMESVNRRRQKRKQNASDKPKAKPAIQ